MQTNANAKSLLINDAGAWAHTLAPTAQDRCDVPEVNRCELGRDDYPLIQRETGIGPIVVASVWLAFYLIAVIYSLAF